MIKVITKQQLLANLPPLVVTKEEEKIYQNSYELESIFNSCCKWLGFLALLFVICNMVFK
jgi:hypothetical protein